ncbi:arginine--tRNA ligase [Ehrlichia chaffeensis str. Heartland]|uniref:arginine--tRNA ligase n=1 Tax=Ehrlichia chaffeensis TaxID=945 RepID=UPI000053AAB3|nr:arginine--tRNA ligase [Ehrlichia chaffeensis]AHX03630.1 arginine--tRNA ligase [Ehrlichia chaffeensis str. Heartland]AHX08639.1 arginine--tRNA ligase [Ehrlichia chaffeensis str. Saint Vincent]AHX10218.1 arginine--tRNA ligase [Ehrlichia chaffeensis str. West Paces]
MNLINTVKNCIVEKLHILSDKKLIVLDDVILSKLIVDYPNNHNHGDLYTNAALILSSHIKKSPLEIAEILLSEFSNIKGISSINVVKPGFINFSISLYVWYEVVASINMLKEGFANVNIGNGQKVNVEFVSANPTGPMHIGHARGAIFGDVLANLLEKVGYQVVREYYINDAGTQIDVLVESVYLRYKEATGQDIVIGSGLYPGLYLREIGKLLYEKYGTDLLEMSFVRKMKIIRDVSLEYLMNLIKEDLALLGIEHDVFTSEAELLKNNIVEKCVKLLEDKQLIYYGVLEQPKGTEMQNWKPRTQMLFKSTDFGDDVDRALQKVDGSWTYFANDIAYHFDKISRGFQHMILELGSDHIGYVKRLKAAVKALSNNNATVDIKLHNTVNFLDDGVQVKMSKRSGEFLTIRDVIEKVGKDVVRFMMLTRKSDVVLDFDFAKVVEQSKNNPIFYVQYAHARVCSLMRNAPNILGIEDTDFSVLSSKEEILLIKLLAKWPNVVEMSAKTAEPHRITFYLIEVAEAFHVLWGYGNKNANRRFIIDNDVNLTSARIYLAKSVAYIISSGLKIFSIVPLEEMH